jgi:hypothetical protein
MPVLISSAYSQAEDVLIRVRTILNDSEVVGGDIITDTAPFSFDLINAAYERVQLELAKVGVETCTTDAWLIGLPIVALQDPEARLIVDDTGTNIIFPNGTGNVFSLTPQLPVDLILPLRLWERQSATNNPLGKPMTQPNYGLHSWPQQTYLMEWEWKNDGIRFRGATQVQDVKILYEKHLPKLAAPTDPVPIRGVVNAAAYFAAKIFADSRGGAIAPEAKLSASEEIFLLQQVSARRRQRKQVRRQPYSGRGGRGSYPI